MNIAIVGYGKMGRLIYRKAVDRGDNVTAVIDPVSDALEITSGTVDTQSLAGADVAIDFSSPSAVVDNILTYARLGIAAVVGTTGWYSEIEELKRKTSGMDCSIIYSGNFSLGVTAFLEITRAAARIMNNLARYDVSVNEIHHIHKKDAPSGTALMVGNILLDSIDRKTGIVLTPDSDEKLLITSQRIGEEPGFHEVVFKSEEDEIRLSHHAFSREGFAAGALAAADWITGRVSGSSGVSGRRTGFFSMDDFAADLLAGNR